MRTFKCEDCGHTWQLPFGQGDRGVDLSCPQCLSRSIYRVESERGGGGRFRHGFRGRGRAQGYRQAASVEGREQSTGNAGTA